MACRFRPKLSNRFNLRTDCDLDGLPLYATRNCHANFHPVRDRGVGDPASLGPIRQRHGESLAARGAKLDSRAVNYGDVAFGRDARTTAPCASDVAAKVSYKDRP